MADTNPILQAARERVEQITAGVPSPTSNIVPGSRVKTIQEAISASTSTIDTAREQAEKGLETGTRATKTIQDAIRQSTESAQTMKRAELSAELNTQNANIKLLEAAGGTEEQVRLMGKLKEDNQRVEELIDQRTDILNDEFTGIQIIDNIINGFRVDRTQLELSSARSEQKQTLGAINSISNAQESFARTNAIAKATLNSSVIEANDKALAAEGQAKAAEQELKNLNTNAQLLGRVMTADAQSVSNLVQGFRLENEAEELELAKERRALEREQMAITREKLPLQLAEAETRLETSTLALEDAKGLTPERRLAMEANYMSDVKSYNDLVNLQKQQTTDVQRGEMILFGPDHIPTERESITDALQPARQNTEIGKKFARLQELGGSVDGSLGTSPFEAKETIKLVAPDGNIPRSPAIELLDTFTQLQTDRYKQEGAKIPETIEEVRKDYNDGAKAYLSIKEASIVKGDTTNPYHSIPFGTLAETSTAIKQSPLYQKILKPMGMKEMDPERIMEATTTAVRSNNITVAEATRGIETIFETAAAYNNSFMGGFKRVGLPNQETYKVRFPRGRLELGATRSVISGGPLSGELIPDLDIIVKPIETGEGPSEEFIIPLPNILGGDTITVDLMDSSEVQHALVLMLSSTPPPAIETDTIPTVSQ